MSAPNDGGPAFPKQPIWKTSDGFSIEMEQPGMTLRDYFAAKAVIWMLQEAHRVKRDASSESLFKTSAEMAYEVADAMLAARGKP